MLLKKKNFPDLKDCVFVADAVKSESVTEGESVSLNSSFTQIHRDEEINWKFGDILIAKVKKNKESKFYGENAEGRFRDRLKLDQTGSLTIINSRTTDSGLYTVISSERDTINTINLTVYAVNVSHVTLSWFKGNSVFSSIRVSDLSSRSDLLLHLECVDDSYSCVLNNPIRNQTQHLNNTQLCHTCAAGVFVADAVKSESVTEGESVSLNSSFTQIHRDEEINWKFGDILIAKVKKNNESKFFGENAEGRFRDRLKLDQTGSLTIINSRTTDSGLYTVSSNRDTINTINLTVYAHLPVPDISRDCSSSSSSSSSCSLVCSAVNVSHVTLSWYRGNSVFSNIRVSDLSISLSLPPEGEYQDKNTYSCVINNPIRNQTRHLNITQLCQPCAAGVLSTAAEEGKTQRHKAQVQLNMNNSTKSTDNKGQTQQRIKGRKGTSNRFMICTHQR
ncbi:CD48 antigen [Anabarilius grahami]|uniref:CD48 antigen n=1 Tax=Anabarilius grahami TaxID=495550 RepID=A0A3N0YUA0_ANAGA|nr:CD48 antigen [Anabarilius grahami]